MADTHATVNNFLNALERIPGIIDQYREKNGILEKEIPQLQEITGKEWKKEDKLKRLKTELAALERKIQLDFRTGTDAGGRRDGTDPTGYSGRADDGIGIHAFRNYRYFAILTRTCTDRKKETRRGERTGQGLQVVKRTGNQNGQGKMVFGFSARSAYLSAFFPILSCNTLRRLSEGCIPSLRRLCVLVLLMLFSFLSRIAQMSLCCFPCRIKQQASRSETESSGKSVSISSIPVSRMERY